MLAVLAAVGVLALLGGPLTRTVAAAPRAGGVIEVGGASACNDLQAAVAAINAGTLTYGCDGRDADTIVLNRDVVLTTTMETGFGLVVSRSMTIRRAEGFRYTISRAEAAPTFTVMVISGTSYVDETGLDVLLQDIEITGGEGSLGGVGAVTATLRVLNSVIRDNVNSGNFAGGISMLNESNLIITDSVISGNRGTFGGGIYTGNRMKVSSSTVYNNAAMLYGGGIIYAPLSVPKEMIDITIENTTVYSNTSRQFSGGIMLFDPNSQQRRLGNVSLINSTIVSNTAVNALGGAFGSARNITLRNNIISGNSAPNLAEVMFQIPTSERAGEEGVLISEHNVFGSSALVTAAAIADFVPGDTDFLATLPDPACRAGRECRAAADSTPTALSDIVTTTLADNGGPTPTLLPNATGPAIDIAPEAACATDADQRGESRPSGSGCDAGSVELQPDSTGVFVSTAAAGTVDELSYGPADILQYDGSEWTKWFDGAAAGLGTPKKFKFNINAIWISDTEDVDVVMSFAQNDRFLPGVEGKVDGMDLMHWNGSAFSLWFDGQDVGLNIKAQEKIDGLHVLAAAPDWSAFSGDNCEAYLLISTHGPGMVPMPLPGRARNMLRFGGEDVLGFCATNLGAASSGLWEMVLDGSAEGVARNNIDSISLSDDGKTLYLTSTRVFSVDEASGGHSMVYTFDMETGEFSGPLFEVYDAGMAMNTKVDALHVSGPLQLP